MRDTVTSQHQGHVTPCVKPLSTASTTMCLYCAPQRHSAYGTSAFFGTVTVQSLIHIRQRQLSNHAKTTTGGSQVSSRRQAPLQLHHHITHQSPHTHMHPWVANPLAHMLSLQPKLSRHMVINPHVSKIGNGAFIGVGAFNHYHHSASLWYALGTCVSASHVSMVCTCA